MCFKQSALKVYFPPSYASELFSYDVTLWSEKSRRCGVRHPMFVCSTIKKKKPTFLCAPRAFPKMRLPGLIITQSCSFDCGINKPFACSRCVICVICVSLRDLEALCAQRIMGCLFNYPQINEVGKPIT